MADMYASMLGGELKFHDISMDDTVVSNTGEIQNAGTLLVIPQGINEKQRIGRLARIRSIQWRYDLKLNATAGATLAGTTDICRMILYVDKQANSATAQVLDILETADYQSFYNLANKTRFRILLDKSVVMNTIAAAGDGAVNDTGDYLKQGRYSKRCNIPIEYAGTDGTIDEIKTNNIGVLLISRLNKVGLASFFRFRFSDN